METEWELAQNDFGVTVERAIEVYYRTDFAHLSNARRYIDAVEVGTDRGDFARKFLDIWNGVTFWCIDPYESYDEMPWPRTGDFFMAAAALIPHATRARLCQMTSRAAAHHFYREGKSADFVYIDGVHTYDAVKEDIALWWPLVRDGGILAGHDFDHLHPGLRRAVLEHALRVGQKVRLTFDTPESWYFYKTEPLDIQDCRSHS